MATVSLVAILRDARKSALLRMRSRCIERDDAASALQLQPDQENAGIVVHAGRIGVQLIVAVLALERELPVEFIGQRGAERRPGVLALDRAGGGADVIVKAVARLHGPD